MRYNDLPFASEHVRNCDLAGNPDALETDVDGFIPLLLA